MSYSSENGSDYGSDSFTLSGLSNLSLFTEDGLFYIIEYCVIFLIILIVFYIVYKLYSNKNSQQDEHPSSIQIPDLENKTIIHALQWCAKNYPDFPALMVRKDNGNWSSITYEDYYKACTGFAKALNYWVGPKSKVAILGFNSPAWFYAHIGCIIGSGVSVGIYPTSTPEACEYILNHAEVNVLVVEDEKQLEKLVGRDISVALILYYSPIPDEMINKFKVPIVSFGAFMESKEKNQVKLAERPKLDDIATIIYTSGTTGDPKGAMITHKNIISSICSILQTITTKSNLRLSKGERFISYLPLNHIAAQTMDIYIPICTLGTVWFADKEALKSTLVNTLKDARPTIFIGVPRVWEKMAQKIEEKIQSNYISRNLPKILIRSKVVNELGLNKCKFCITSGAPISEKARDYFESLNVMLYDVYGLSETTGPITISMPKVHQRGSVGVILDGVRIKIDHDGEILVKGKCIFKGYYKDPKASKEAFKNAWFRTGDIGSVQNGFLYITGRKKELIITSGGENIAPVPIEQAALNLIEGVEYAVVIGDKQRFLSLLLAPKLSAFKKIDPDCTTIDDLNKSKKVAEYMDPIIVQLNSKSPSSASKIQKYLFINEFAVGRELTPTLKVRRHFVTSQYKDKIDTLYKEIK